MPILSKSSPVPIENLGLRRLVTVSFAARQKVALKGGTKFSKSPTSCTTLDGSSRSFGSRPSAGTPGRNTRPFGTPFVLSKNNFALQSCWAAASTSTCCSQLLQAKS